MMDRSYERYHRMRRYADDLAEAMATGLSPVRFTGEEHTQFMTSMVGRYELGDLSYFTPEQAAEAKMSIIRHMTDNFRRIGTIEDVRFDEEQDPFSMRPRVYLIGRALVIPHDSTRRWLNERHVVDRRSWQERLADITASVERVAEVKVRDIYYRDAPNSRAAFDALMEARAKLKPWEWRFIAGRDHYAPYGQRDRYAENLWELTGVRS